MFSVVFSGSHWRLMKCSHYAVAFTATVFHVKQMSPARPRAPAGHIRRYWLFYGGIAPISASVLCVRPCVLRMTQRMTIICSSCRASEIEVCELVAAVCGDGQGCGYRCGYHLGITKRTGDDLYRVARAFASRVSKGGVCYQPLRVLLLGLWVASRRSDWAGSVMVIPAVRDANVCP